MQRVFKIMRDAEYRHFLQENARREEDRRFCRHDPAHLKQVARLAWQLVQRAGLDKLLQAIQSDAWRVGREVVYAAGLLHDIGRWQEYDSGTDHALAGAELAAGILQRAGFSETERQIICRAIREHRRGGPQASLLGQALCLADDLSRPCRQCAARRECKKYGYMVELQRRVQLL
ncbi:HD domain-containing protein [Desulfurispora thermophila]|uniref:HD domain-containing protein n=1 Tax=Desulfurispora thermophila TaxID=265470 RepID=UPI0003677847|nr:HD domain-containing protein [Desulfurispora thermophila]